MENSRQSECGEIPLSKVMTTGELEAIGARLIADAAARQPAKVMARLTGLTERHIRSLRQQAHAPGWAAFVALAQSCPELRQAVARWLGLTPGPEAALLHKLAHEIERYRNGQPEAGDQANGG